MRTHHSRPVVLMSLGMVLLIAGYLLLERSALNPTDKIAQRIDRNLREEVAVLEREGNQLMRQPETWHRLMHSFFRYDSGQLTRWNENHFVPAPSMLQSVAGWYLLRTSDGLFLARQWRLDGQSWLLGVVNLFENYKINNQYLHSNWNPVIFPTQDVEMVSPSAGGKVFMIEERALFSYVVTSGAYNEWVLSDTLELILLPFGGLLLLMGFVAVLIGWHERGERGRVVIFLMVGLLGLRLATLYVLPPFTADLFNPSYFASSSYNRSVGDLLINTLVVLAISGYFFWNAHTFPILKRTLRLTGPFRLGVGVISLIVCFFAFLFPFLFIETISHNSSISLDISQSLQFDTIRAVSFLTIVLASVSAFFVLHFFYRLAEQLITARLAFYLSLLLATSVFLFYARLAEREYGITILVGLLFFASIHFLGLARHLKKISFATFLYLLLLLVANAAQGSLAIRKLSQERRVSAQFRFANDFLVDRDYLAEYLLDEAVHRIATDPFIQSRISSPFLGKGPVRQKIKQVFLSSYFDKYDVSVHIFNGVGNAYDNSTSENFTTLIQNFDKEANKTNFDHIYFVKNVSEEAVKQYLAWIPIHRLGAVSGYVVLDLSLRRIIPDNVFPELLLDNRFSEYFKNRDFSYAFTTETEISSRFGEFNYERDFDLSHLRSADIFSEGMKSGDFYHVALEYERDRYVIVSSPAYATFNLITNLSFLLTEGLFALLVAILIYAMVTRLKGEQLNYSARIQLYVYLAFLLPLVIVSVSTLGLINNSNESQLRGAYAERARRLGDLMAPVMEVYHEDPSSKAELDNQLIALTKVGSLDASIYSEAGELVTTSQPLIYEYGIFSPFIAYDARNAIVSEKEQFLVTKEAIGSLNFNVVYTSLKSPDTGELLGILSLPFFDSARLLDKTQLNVMSNILVIFCVVFLLFSVGFYFAMRNLTRPLRFIAQSLSKTSLTRSNAPMAWNAKDEIGLLVNEYNQMLANLEQNKVELSRIQKESAWREMARQVAHEIKNPLTPMKLTMQRMEQALLKGHLDKDQIEHALRTLLSQLEILNEIAASFSAFARLPAPILQRIDLSGLLKKVVQLHQGYPEGNVELKIQHEPIYVMGDEQLLSRVFSNIIINGLQAGQDGQKVLVEVEARVNDRFCEIGFKDNGAGIDEEMKSKIFVPYFTTKKSGSGLGLAIAKQGIEQNGGTIEFFSRVGEGTRFVIKLPLTG